MFCLAKLSKTESIINEANTHFVNEKELEILVVAFIQILKKENKKYGKKEVFRLVKGSLDKHITREAVDSTLNSMIGSHSGNLIIVDKQKYLSLPKQSCRVNDDTVD